MTALGDQLAALTAQAMAQLNADAETIASLEAEIAALKEPPPLPLLAGLSSINMTKPPTFSPSAYILNVYWSQLQATPGGALLSPNPIDTALASGKPFRVRLFFGSHSPGFAAAMAGTIQMTVSQDKVTALVPNWLNPDLQAAQADFVAKLAAAYDGKISSIFLASNSTIYAEPFIREVNDAPTRAALLAAPGYTVAADQASYRSSMDIFSAFKQTRLAWAFNPYEYVNPDGSQGKDDAFTSQMIDEFRTRFPSGIVQNNSIRTPAIPAYASMYAQMKASPPSSYQTATLPRVGDLAATLQWAVDEGAHLVEMNAGWALTADQLAGYDAALKANAA